MTQPTANFEMTDAQAKNFWAKVHKTDGCWMWTGAVARGYGQFHVGSKTIGAHRISYMLIHGVVNGDVQVDHMCFTRACVNPAHLRGVTPKGNQEHRRSAQRNSSTGVLGVSRRKGREKYEVCVQHNNRSLHGGTYATLAEAEQAAIMLRIELFTCNDLDRVRASSETPSAVAG